MRATAICNTALLFSTAVSAWPSLWAPVEAFVKREISHLESHLEARQATSTSQSKFDLSFSATQGQVTSTTATGSASGSTAATTGSNTGSNTGSQKTSGSSDASKTTMPASTTVFDPRLNTGGISMVTPNSMTGPTYYKIKDYVTFAWNYTSVSILPSAIDILAYASKNSHTYTLALNQTVTPNATQAFTWDTDSYQTSADIKLLTETYTLIVHDAAKDVSATAKAGYLGTANQFTFQMYLPQKYTPLSDWVCATCSGAVTSAERHTIGFLFGMVAVTVLSFGWFTGVAGLW